MNSFLANLLLALVWAMATSQFTLPNLVVGFVISYLVLWIAARGTRRTGYFTRMPRVVGFMCFYLWELILANLRVAYDVVTPTHYMKPGVIAIPLDAKTDVEISMLSNLITLTPGTLCLDVSADRKVLYIHAMYIDRGDVESLRRSIKDSLERRVLEVLR